MYWKNTGSWLTVYLKVAWSFSFSDTVLWDTGVSALIVTPHLSQTQAVVAADLKSGTSTEKIQQEFKITNFSLNSKVNAKFKSVKSSGDYPVKLSVYKQGH